MCGKHRCQQCCLRQPHAKYGNGCDGSEDQRYKESECPEYKPLGKILLQVVHVNLYAGKKHEVKDSHLTEHFEAHVSVQQGESVGPHCDTCYDKPDYMRYFQAVEQQWSHKDYCHHREEDGHRFSDGRHSQEWSNLRNHSTANLLKILQN